MFESNANRTPPLVPRMTSLYVSDGAPVGLEASEENSAEGLRCPCLSIDVGSMQVRSVAPLQTARRSASEGLGFHQTSALRQSGITQPCQAERVLQTTHTVTLHVAP